ncbi:MAG: tRNA (guanosine(46)-N7)-methyltransferase TrmB [Oceanococcus sp.]
MDTRIQHEPGPPRTYVRREGRMTDGQKRAMDEFLPRYAYPDTPTSPSDAFARQARCILEIGFGNGENLAVQARDNPDQDFIGLEVHRPGVGYLLQAAEDDKLNNLRVSSEDALIFMDSLLPEACIDQVQIYFPDPWPKKRHHKRRMVRAQAMSKVARIMKPGGILLLATDWDNYAEQMMEVMSEQAEFENAHGAGQFAPRSQRVLTRFEKRAHGLGHQIHDLAFIRK